MIDRLPFPLDVLAASFLIAWRVALVFAILALIVYAKA